MKNSDPFIISTTMLVINLAVTVGIYFGFRYCKALGNSSSITPAESRYTFDHTTFTGGVVSNGYECAAIGCTILEKGGSAVDAAISTLLCEGVVRSESTGLGGGFLMNIYTKETNSAITLIARETAPALATTNMFDGGLSVAIPGDLRGYEYAHKRFGKLPWSELIEPTIKLCKKGYVVTSYLEEVYKKYEGYLQHPTLREIFIDPYTNRTYKSGQYLKRLKLAETLKVVAREGADALYDGRLTKGFVDDIRRHGGIITEDDMKQYRPIWRESIVAKLPFDQTLHTVPLPGSGAILILILNVLSGYLDTKNINNATNWQRIVETFKYAYAKRTEFGDPDFVPGMKELVKDLTSSAYADLIRSKVDDTKTFNNSEHYGAHGLFKDDHGTANIVVIAPNGDAVCATGTINHFFGAGFASPTTGIILNDQMDDFGSPNIVNIYGVPPSPANFITPLKRAVSSMCPSIITNENGEPILVIGAAGGPKITTGVALVAMRYLWFNESLSHAIASPRLHHQLLPMRILFEERFDKDLIKKLSELGHEVMALPPEDGFVALTAMSKLNGIVQGSIDPRRGGRLCLIGKVNV